MSNQTPKKGDIVINPKTQRPVKVGSRTWLKLVREGVFQGTYSDPKEIYSVQDGEDENDLIEKFNKTLPPNQQAVRGRGKYANKIVKRHRQPTIETTSRYTVKKTANKIKNREVYEDLQEGGNFEEDLEALIMSELANYGNDNYDYLEQGANGANEEEYTIVENKYDSEPEDVEESEEDDEEYIDMTNEQPEELYEDDDVGFSEDDDVGFSEDDF